MAQGFYVIAQRLSYPYSIKYLIGPYRSSFAAQRMIVPVRRAIENVPEYANCEVRLHHMSKKNLPVGKMDLTLLRPGDVIEASRKL